MAAAVVVLVVVAAGTVLLLLLLLLHHINYSHHTTAVYRVLTFINLAEQYFKLILQSILVSSPLVSSPNLHLATARPWDGFPAMHFTPISRHPHLSPSPRHRGISRCVIRPPLLDIMHTDYSPVPAFITARRDGRSGTATAAADDSSHPYPPLQGNQRSA